MKALEQFKQRGSKEGKQDWRTSKFVYAISAMQTYVFQLNDCIRDTLHCVDLHGSVIAALHGVPHLYTETKVILLGEQKNYVCLNGQALAENSDSRYVKQRTDRWHEIRKTAKVTGSTANAAVGLDTLKRQKEHFYHVICKVEKPHPDVLASERMKHGSDNEINAWLSLSWALSRCQQRH
jgi:hypothetical protein